MPPDAIRPWPQMLKSQIPKKAWIINIACQKPVDLGYSAEVWTRALTKTYPSVCRRSRSYTSFNHKSVKGFAQYLEEAEIKSRIRSRITAKTGILTLIRRCITSFWFISSCRFSLTKMDTIAFS